MTIRDVFRQYRNKAGGAEVVPHIYAEDEGAKLVGSIFENCFKHLLRTALRT